MPLTTGSFIAASGAVKAGAGHSLMLMDDSRAAPKLASNTATTCPFWMARHSPWVTDFPCRKISAWQYIGPSLAGAIKLIVAERSGTPCPTFCSSARYNSAATRPPYSARPCIQPVGISTWPSAVREVVIWCRDMGTPEYVTDFRLG